MKAGAASVLAADIDGFSLEAIRLNAELNGVEIAVTGEDLLAGPAPDCDVILVGDLFYEKDLAGTRLLLAGGGGGAGASSPSSAIRAAAICRARSSTKLGEYKVQVTRDLEDAEIKMTSVWRLSRYC